MNRIKLQHWLQEAIPLLLWLGFVLLPFLMRSPVLPADIRRHFLENVFLSNILLLSLFYLHAYLIYPLLKRKRGVWWYLAALGICISLFMFLSKRLSPGPPMAIVPRGLRYPERLPDSVVLRRTGVRRNRDGNRFFLFHDSLQRPFPGPPGTGPRISFHMHELRILPLLFVILCSYCYCILKDNNKREQALKEHENEYLKTELGFLRSQISPHFMFNVLNSMVSLSRKQSPMLETSLINMSNLMRYMLYESNGRHVPLNTELEYLKNYIDLQLLRHGDSVRLNLYINGDAAGYCIEPMLLIPFVENAFKHGIDMIEDPLIDISVTIDNNRDTLLFQVVNSSAGRKATGEEGTGIGLINVKRRLMLLYPGKHQIHIEQKNTVYTVELQINLA